MNHPLFRPSSGSAILHYTWSSIGLFCACTLIVGLVLYKGRTLLSTWTSTIKHTQEPDSTTPSPKPILTPASIPISHKPAKQERQYFLVLDVEATCVPGNDFTWPNEIIEWPVVLLTWEDMDEQGYASKLKVVDEFRSYVRPTWRPALTQFCMSLTGISQKDVDAAPTFPTVLDNCRKFLIRNGLICPKTGNRLCNYVWVTDGPYDIRDFVVKQCFISKIKMPDWVRGDVLDSRRYVYDLLGYRKGDKKSVTLNLTRQLSALSLPPFEGRQHCGIDDTRNISRIVIELARRGVRLIPNLKISPNRRWYWMGSELGQIVEAYFPESLAVAPPQSSYSDDNDR